MKHTQELAVWLVTHIRPGQTSDKKNQFKKTRHCLFSYVNDRNLGAKLKHFMSTKSAMSPRRIITQSDPTVQSPPPLSSALFPALTGGCF